MAPATGGELGWVGAGFGAFGGFVGYVALVMLPALLEYEHLRRHPNPKRRRTLKFEIGDAFVHAGIALAFILLGVTGAIVTHPRTNSGALAAGVAGEAIVYNIAAGGLKALGSMRDDAEPPETVTPPV